MTYSTAVSAMSRAALGALLGLCLTAGLLPRAEALVSSSAFVVNHTADDLQPGSLRSEIALAEAIPGSTVVFQIPASDPGFNSAAGTVTIALTSGPVIVSATSGLSIAGGNTPAAAVVVDGAQQSRVFSITAGKVTLSGLTIQNGSASQGSVSFPEPEGGGGILNTAALTLTNCMVTGNSTNGLAGGGGINNSGTGASLTLNECTITQNSDQFGGGGGIANSGTLKAAYSILTGNTASFNAASGGGLFNTGTATLNGCTLSGNTASPSNVSFLSGGGGAYNSGTLTLNSCTVSSNVTPNDGGGINNGGGGSLTLSACIINDNTANRDPNGTGGGIENGGTAQITNCLVVNNFGFSVGGLDNAGSLTLINSTLAGNSTGGFSFGGGSGPSAGGLRSGAATLLNDIFYFDTSSATGPPLPSEIVAAAGTAGPTVTYSDVQGGYAGAGNISGDPQFASVPGGDYHIPITSPAARAGAAGTASNGVPLTDLDGHPRPSPPSMGAYDVPATSSGFSAQGGFTITGTQNVATAAQAVAKFLPGAANASGFTATIDFGDGSALTAGTISADPTANGVYQVTGSHTYASYGTFTVTTVISGPNGTPTATVTSKATIQPAQVAANVTSQVSVFRGGFYYNRFTKIYSQTVTIKNTGAAAITGPISLVLDALTPGAALVNPSGTTQYAPPAGSPYLNAAATSIAPGATISLVVQMTYTGSARFGYTPRVLAGPGAR